MQSQDIWREKMNPFWVSVDNDDQAWSDLDGGER